jgi:hypothetical protein
VNHCFVCHFFAGFCASELNFSTRLMEASSLHQGRAEDLVACQDRKCATAPENQAGENIMTGKGN